MLRIAFLSFLVVASAGCTPGPRYTYEDVTANGAGQRAATYCAKQGATAKLQEVQPRGPSRIETYECNESE